jgi:hypothetical protein
MKCNQCGTELTNEDMQSTSCVCNNCRTGKYNIPLKASASSFYSPWECPRCHKIHAPWKSSCDCQPLTVGGLPVQSNLYYRPNTCGCAPAFTGFQFMMIPPEKFRPVHIDAYICGCDPIDTDMEIDMLRLQRNTDKAKIFDQEQRIWKLETKLKDCRDMLANCLCIAEQENKKHAKSGSIVLVWQILVNKIRNVMDRTKL